MSYQTGTFVMHIRSWSAAMTSFPWLANKVLWNCEYGGLTTGMYIRDPEAPDFAQGMLVPFNDIEYYYQTAFHQANYYMTIVATNSSANSKPDWQVQAEAHGWTPPKQEITSITEHGGTVALRDQDIVPLNKDGTITLTCSFDSNVFEKYNSDERTLAMSEVQSWEKVNGTKVKVTSFVEPHRE